MKTVAILPAAGRGKRMNSPLEKQFYKIEGKPVLCHTLDRFEVNEFVNEVYLVLPEDKMDFCKNVILGKYRYKKLTKFIVGGEKRQHSVYNAFKELDPDVEIVLVHDVVRPFLKDDIINQSISIAELNGAVITALPVVETIKEVVDGRVVQTTDRTNLVQVQTPQTFLKSVLEKGFEAAIKDDFVGTDEASLLERIGVPVTVIQGDPLNMKLTTPDDLVFANTISVIWRRQGGIIQG